MDSNNNNEKIIICKKDIVKGLHGKLLEDDILKSEEMIDNNRKERQILIDILIGNCCNSCTELTKCECPNRSIPYGNMSSNIVFVKKRPTTLECSTMLTHSDTAGHFLMLILNKLGLSPNNLYFTDLIKCSANLSSEESYFNCIHNYFLKEIYHIKPKAMIFQGLMGLNILYKSGILLDTPERIEYGKIYESYLISRENPVKVIGIYDLDMVLEKDGDKLKECKNTVWHNLSSIVKAIQS